MLAIPADDLKFQFSWDYFMILLLKKKLMPALSC